MKNSVEFEGLVGKSVDIKTNTNKKKFGFLNLAQSTKNSQTGDFNTVWMNDIYLSEKMINKAKGFLAKGKRISIKGFYASRTKESKIVNYVIAVDIKEPLNVDGGQEVGPLEVISNDITSNDIAFFE
ncbi:hypothetical protein A9Q84_00235 [Halobacteriovorax marinus]|uniref:Single-stranded DNA-binding protein n=1 Tax=Halobacteriovorax marinus TaxID=97084 RepID=A0A1Y5FJU3_9BACT|nr:hypothetical protein A9Q84_00235 [Halobacteriovorax marinus]